MKTMIRIIALLFTVVPLSIQNLDACTGITLTGSDNSVVRGRTVEWGTFDIKPRLAIIPRGTQFSAQAMPDGKAGITWKAKYGVVATDGLHRDAYVDGINEKGLSIGIFYLPGFAEYVDYDPKQAGVSMAPADVAGFLLTQFATIAEVREALTKIRIVKVVEPSLGFPMPLHWFVSEPSGKSIVIELVKEGLTIYDATLGVITNAPTYDWHLTNLRNYLNLSAISLPTKKIADMKFAPLGAGSGMIGLPGDFTPPSRFVRAVAFSQSARPTKGGFDTVREVFRILDNFNVPIGAAEGSEEGVTKDPLYSATQWTTAADMKNLVFYYHTQYNRAIRMVDLKRINFGAIGGKIIHRPLDETKEPTCKDLTPKGK